MAGRPPISPFWAFSLPTGARLASLTGLHNEGFPNKPTTIDHTTAGDAARQQLAE